jgi:hypothetical protein
MTADSSPGTALMPAWPQGTHAGHKPALRAQQRGVAEPGQGHPGSREPQVLRAIARGGERERGQDRHEQRLGRAFARAEALGG